MLNMESCGSNIAKPLGRHDDVIYRTVTFQRNEPISPPIQVNHNKAILTLSTLQIIIGFSLVFIGAAVNSYTQSHGPGYSPHIWWTGLIPLQMGGLGVFVYIVKQSKKAFYWGILSPSLTVLQAVIMGLCGNFNPGYYGAWPYAGTHNGHPICMYMVSSCYCQDYFHGKLSQIEQPHVQYIHEDAKWKDSGYTDCDHMELLSRMFYSTMLIFGLSVVLASVIFIFSLYITVLWPRKIRFEKLKDEETHLEECFGPHKRYSELQDMSCLTS